MQAVDQKYATEAPEGNGEWKRAGDLIGDVLGSDQRPRAARTLTMSGHLREVKLRLWDATKRELLHFASRYREEHVIGHDVSGEQRRVLHAAKVKGYPATLVRFLGALKRADALDAAALERIAEYRSKIGLKSSCEAAHD